MRDVPAVHSSRGEARPARAAFVFPRKDGVTRAAAAPVGMCHGKRAAGDLENGGVGRRTAGEQGGKTGTQTLPPASPAWPCRDASQNPESQLPACPEDVTELHEATSRSSLGLPPFFLLFSFSFIGFQPFLPPASPICPRPPFRLRLPWGPLAFCPSWWGSLFSPGPHTSSPGPPACCLSFLLMVRGRLASHSGRLSCGGWCSARSTLSRSSRSACGTRDPPCPGDRHDPPFGCSGGTGWT